jgi:hypothetical protein
MFSPAAWDPSSAPVLIRPALVDGIRRGMDPVNGTIYPAIAIGQLAPGLANFANGVILNNQPGVPRGLVNSTGVQFNSRIGFAWDILVTAEPQFAGASEFSRARVRTTVCLLTTVHTICE